LEKKFRFFFPRGGYPGPLGILCGGPGAGQFGFLVTWTDNPGAEGNHPAVDSPTGFFECNDCCS